MNGSVCFGEEKRENEREGEKEGEEEVGRGQGVGRCNRTKRKVVNARKVFLFVGSEIAFWVVGLFPV